MKATKEAHGIQSSGGILLRCFSKEATPYWGMFAIALAIRVIHQIIMSRNDPMYGFLMQGGDMHTYDRWALEISQTFWLGWNRIPFLHGPLYPYFLGFIYLRFGHSIDAAVWAQRVLGAVTVVLILWLARRTFGKRAGWIAGTGAALCPLFLLYEGEILVETLVVFVNMLALCIFVKAGEERKTGWWLLGGVALGISCLGRPNMLLLIPFVAGWMATIAPGSLRQKAIAAVLFLAATMVTMSPATFLNYFVGNKLHLVTYSGAVNLYIGNAPDSIGIYCTPPSMRAILEKEQKKEMDINWMGYLWRAWREEPSILPRKLWLKTTFFWQSGELPSDINYYLKRPFSPFLALPFRWAVIAPIGVIGFFLAFWKERPKSLADPRLTMLMYFLLYMVSIIIIFVPDRLRLSALAILFIFAGCALSLVVETLQNVIRERKNCGPSVALITVVLVSWTLLGVSLKSNGNELLIRWCDHFNLGSAYEMRKQPHEALKYYEKAILLAPENAALAAARNSALEKIERPSNRPFENSAQKNNGQPTP